MSVSLGIRYAVPISLGIAWMGKELHGRGLRFGIYTFAADSDLRR